jgi:hypothetical protein
LSTLKKISGLNREGITIFFYNSISINSVNDNANININQKGVALLRKENESLKRELEIVKREKELGKTKKINKRVKS